MRETAPATPPAMNDATTGCDSHVLVATKPEGSGGVSMVGACGPDFKALGGGMIGSTGEREVMVRQLAVSDSYEQLVYTTRWRCTFTCAECAGAAAVFALVSLGRCVS